MEHFGISRASLREKALERLACYVAKCPSGNDSDDYRKLCESMGSTGNSYKKYFISGVRKSTTTPNGNRYMHSIPINTRELEVLLALAASAPSLKDEAHAKSLMKELRIYYSDIFRQQFVPSPLLRELTPSPWEYVTYALTVAIADIGQSFADLRGEIMDLLCKYMLNLKAGTDAIAEPYDFNIIFPLIFSLRGFMSAICSRPFFHEESGDQYKLLCLLNDIFVNDLATRFDECLSSLQSSENESLWLKYQKIYASSDKILGSLPLRLCYIETLRHIVGRRIVTDKSIGYSKEYVSFLGCLISGTRMNAYVDDFQKKTLQLCTEIALDTIKNIEDSVEYMEYSNDKLISTVFAIKASAMEILCFSTLLDMYSSSDMIAIIESTLLNEDQLVDQVLVTTLFKIMALLCRLNPDIGSSLTRIFPRLIVRYNATKEIIESGTVCVAYALQFLSEDAVISTLYTLSNILVGVPDRASPHGPPSVRSRYTGLERITSMGSNISLLSGSEEENNIILENVIHGMAEIVEHYEDAKITALAISVLMQKIGRVNAFIDRVIVIGLSGLSLTGIDRDFKTVLKLYSRLCAEAVANGDTKMKEAILDARFRVAKKLPPTHPYYELFIRDLLDGIVSKGDVMELEHHRPHQEITVAAEEISLLLQPLAKLLPPVGDTPFVTEDQSLLTAFRNAWFNMVVHGYSRDSEWSKKFKDDLEAIAWNSPPLIAESSSNQFESDMEINTVLRRGSSHHNVSEQRQQLSTAFESTSFELRTLPYPKLIFLSATLLLESLRASAGSCSKILVYFVDPSLKSGETSKFMMSIVNEVIRIYLGRVLTKSEVPAAANISGQLRELLIFCCHRIKSVSTAAINCTQRIVERVPTALCNRESLFTLLELLTLMWNSCLDEDTDQYSPRSVFTSSKAKIRLELSDSYSQRRSTLRHLHEKARIWVQLAIDSTPLDMKGLLQTYLSQMDDFRAFGHIALGRSFAVEMGGRIPFTDNKLSSIERRGDTFPDTVSDFLSQYTWRQVYRGVESYDESDSEYPSKEFNNLKMILENMQEKVEQKKYVSIAELRETLLRAASFSLKNQKMSASLMKYVVSIPFMIFSKQSIKLGVSLWLWILNEASQLQSRLLGEILFRFEYSIRRSEGLYSRAYDLDPILNCKMEYSPSSKEEIAHDARIAISNFAPHLYIINMLISHFHSSKFQSGHVFEMFERSVRIALINMKNASMHPLSRETRFSIILFSLQLLDGYNSLSSQRCTFLKNLTLTAALTWFAKPAEYPFGGNRLQLKSEFRLLLEVFELVKSLTIKGPEKALFIDAKQDLLLQFLDSEVYAMSIWLDPLQFVPYRQLKAIIPKKSFEPSTTMAIVAWQVDPALSVYYAKRFKNPEVDTQLRQLMIADTSKVVHVSDALSYLIGSKVSSDTSPELRYLQFWTPASPIEAINLFLPEFSKNILILQYAMRSLESHNVDVTFFYVPQIVQMLRHDNLRYIERYILETAQLSQLFAHQIIWNMKSNAYKDEDSTIPDPLKPTLDRVEDSMISMFNDEDKPFYEREFAFFKEVTSISAKLKPYIKKTKAEKKLKIDEEMKKINVDVGVYLPSNPSGEVIGIDRKSGRPLQSHAKAPFMATFKIRQTIKTVNTVRMDGEDDTENTVVETVDKWLSAIFKVGDDCRQDMLALQLIALFRSIFNASGLDLFLFPYRVIATAPGCGVIDVLPNSISRDMLGREAVNGLYEYFISKHGSEDSILFQKARNNFVQSLAAYSVVSYLLQFKDRHNGNIMYDDQGHILHIDFGFCFDIVPGGVKFEAAPFKLTHEMVQVMGGSSDTQAYHWFEELCIKAFLVCRPYAESIIMCVRPMLESGLPCFKGETTIRKLRERFVLDKTDKEAAVYMRGLIKKSAESIYTKGYDEFQRMTNGIPVSTQICLD
ncbi:hypothetical protein V1511DRAFT_465025 [Dipodascopsis uninucleata]